MKKSEIKRYLSEKFNLQSIQSEKVLDIIIGQMTKALKDNNRVEIRGFGSFFTKRYNSYDGRNPRTGEHVSVPDKKLPHFRPSKELVEKLNEKVNKY